MPTILIIAGWRLFFYSNENNEPLHVHAEKAEMDCKYWLKVDDFEIEEAHAYNMTKQAKREIKKIIYEHYDYIVSEWYSHFKKGN